MRRDKKRRLGLWALLAGGVLALGTTLAAGAQTTELTVTETPTVAQTAVPAATPTPTPASTTAAPGCETDSSDPEEADGASFEAALNTLYTGADYAGGPHNVVKLKNKVSGKLRVKGNVQLNTIGDDTVVPFNYAIAYNACGVEAQTLAVALQINVYRQGASTVSPENHAAAVNYGCTRCAALAFAVQYVYASEDPKAVPAELEALAKALDAEMRAIHADSSGLTLAQAYARMRAVMTEFNALSAQVKEAVDELPAE